MPKATLQLVPPKKAAKSTGAVSQDFKNRVDRMFKTSSTSPTGWPEGPVWVKAELCHDNPFQHIARPDGHTADDIERMRDSLNRLGQIQEGLARPHPEIPGELQLAVAHGRRAGVLAGGNAGDPQLPPAERARFAGQLRLVVRNFSDEEMLELLAAENDIRTNTNPISRANLYLKLYEIAAGGGQSVTWEKVAADHNLSYRTVRRYVALLDLPRLVRRRIQTGQMEMAYAPALLKFKNEEQPTRWTPNMKTLYRAIIREELSGAQAMERARVLEVAQGQGTIPFPENDSAPTSGGPGLSLVPDTSTEGAAPASGGGATRTRSKVATMETLPTLVASQLDLSAISITEAVKGIKQLDVGKADREDLRGKVKRLKSLVRDAEKLLGKGQ